MNKDHVGKIRENDEGQTSISVSIEKDHVIVEFPMATKWIGLDDSTALALANVLIKHANELRKRKTWN